MLLRTKGIVIHSIKYSENSLISKVFTKNEGLLSIISSTSKKRGEKGKVYFQAMTEIEVVIYFKQNSKLHRLKEVSFANKPSSADQNMSITALKFFLAEILSLVIKEEEENVYLYQYLATKISQLNTGNIKTRLFHIDFLYDLSQYLGIQPSFHKLSPYFDLVEGSATQEKPRHEQFLLEEDCKILYSYFNTNYSPSKKETNHILGILLEYYQIQIGNISQLKSRAVLEMVFA